MESPTPKKQGGIDRSYDSSLGPKLVFFLLHGIGVALSAYLIWGGGIPVIGAWFGKTWSVTEPLRTKVMFAAVVLYWLRHGVTLFYLLQRKVDWSEVLGLSAFLILLEPGFCLLASGVTRNTPVTIGVLFWIAIFCVLLGSYLNTASEVQRKWWKADPANKGKCYTEGLFRYSMHINFLGDSISFTGWALLTGVWWSLIVPAFMTVSFIFYHIPALDRYLEDRYGDPFRDYAKRTKKFVPFVYLLLIVPVFGSFASGCSQPSQVVTVCETDSQCATGNVCQSGACAAGECSATKTCPSGKICKAAICTSCAQDSECGADLICQKGQCLQACSDANPCKDGQICKNKRCEDCTDDTACTAGLVCLGGRCKTGCRENTACQKGQVCQNNQCTACSNDQQCSPGQICEQGTCQAGCRDHKGCQSGQICDITAKICKGCLQNTDCLGGLICSNQICSPCKDDVACGTGTLCLNQVCVVGDCRQSGDCKNGAICRKNICNPCSLDSECTAGQICVQGTCMTGDCRQSADCKDGKVCKKQICSVCTDDAECSAGQLCLTGVCTPGFCRAATDCSGGLVCKNNRCATCADDKECTTGQLCLRGLCLQANCRTDTDCAQAGQPTGQICKNNTCTACANDRDCNTTQLCLSGLCKTANCRTHTDCTDGKLCLANTCSTCANDTECGTGKLCINSGCQVGDCRIDTDCSGGKLCKKNLCSLCFTDQECGVGKLCLAGNCQTGNCRTVSECTNGQICKANTCTACTDDKECVAGQLCLSGACTAATCRTNNDCLGGLVCLSNTCGVCTKHADCGSGKICSGGICRTGNCLTSSDCTGGQVCINNTCSPCTQNNQCSSGLVCVSGACTLGVVELNGAFRWSDGSYAKHCREYLNPPSSFAPATQDGLYWIKPDTQAHFKVYCNMTLSGGGWTLVASFINSDGTNRWTRPTGDGNWRNATTFGTVETYTSTDYKSEAWSRLSITDLMVTDETGGWLSYKGVLTATLLQTLFSSMSSCQTKPLVPPGDSRIDSSSPLYKQSAMLAFYTGDPNAGNVCSYSGSHSDSTILAIGGHGCGSIGAGQWGTNYNAGMDWHANLSNASVCVACDACGPWYGHKAITSKEHSNNKGIHDNSNKGFLWIR